MTEIKMNTIQMKTAVYLVTVFTPAMKTEIFQGGHLCNVLWRCTLSSFLFLGENSYSHPTPNVSRSQGVGMGLDRVSLPNWCDDIRASSSSHRSFASRLINKSYLFRISRLHRIRSQAHGDFLRGYSIPWDILGKFWICLAKTPSNRGSPIVTNPPVVPWLVSVF